MMKKDYKIIADVLKEVLFQTKNKNFVQLTINLLNPKLQEDNYRFNQKKFEKAIYENNN